MSAKPSTAPAERAALRGPRRQLIYQLIETSRLLSGYIEHVALAHDTTRAQWGLLAVLRSHEGASQADLAIQMGIAPISLARLIDRTQAQGLIERRAHATDRRINRLFLSERGRAVVDGLDQQRREIADVVMADADMDQVVAATALLAEMAARIRGHDSAIQLAASAAKPTEKAGAAKKIAIDAIGHRDERTASVTK